MTSRREFLKKAGLLTAAFTVPTLNTQGETTQSRLSLKNTKIAVDDRWDVIVVGGGPGGCAAAISAAREGAKTLLIEAMGQLGRWGTAVGSRHGVRFLMVRRLFIEVWQRKFLKLRGKEYRMRENRK